MKRLIISLLAASMAAATGYSQLNFGPVVSVVGNSSEATGVAVSGTLWFSTVGSVGTLTYRINNLSGTESYTPGDLTGFSIGFNTDDFTYQADSFAVLNGGDSFLLADVTMTQAILFEEGVPTGPGAFVLDVSAKSTNGPQDALDGGYWAEFEFKFDIAPGATFDAGGFFLTTDALDLTWRLQTVGADGQRSDFFGLDLGEDPGGGGGGFVPEPSTYGMFGALALLGLMVIRQLRRR